MFHVGWCHTKLTSSSHWNFQGETNLIDVPSLPANFWYCSFGWGSTSNSVFSFYFINPTTISFALKFYYDFTHAFTFLLSDIFHFHQHFPLLFSFYSVVSEVCESPKKRIRWGTKVKEFGWHVRFKFSVAQLNSTAWSRLVLWCRYKAPLPRQVH